MPKVSRDESKEVITDLERDLTQACRTYLRETADEQQHVVDTLRLKVISEELLRWLIL